MSYDRDGDIYKLSNAGVSLDRLSSYYKMSKSRISSIISEQYRKRRIGNPDIYQIDIMCRILGWREQDRGKLQSVLHKNGYTSFDDKWKKLSSDDILAIPLLGPGAVCIIWLAQNMAGFDVEDWCK